jgi:protease-4
LAARKPIVVYIGNVAASGGYYVAAPASHIMSQQGTITGSIGVITAKINAAGLYERLSVNHVSLERGQHAGLYRDSAPLSEEERDLFRRAIGDIYEDFKKVVAQGRHMTTERVDEIGGGRVWTGRQALGHGLIDSHGDFQAAIKKAAELAALPHDDLAAITVVNLFARDSGYVLPASRSNQIVEEAARILSGRQLLALSGKPLMLLPYELRFW